MSNINIYSGVNIPINVGLKVYPPNLSVTPQEESLLLSVSEDSRYLVDGNGNPFLLNADAAWSGIGNLLPSEWLTYFSAFQAAGGNATIVQLFCHLASEDPPNTPDGIEPFTSGEDFTTVNSTYLERARAFVDLAATYGIIIILAPLYLGFGGGSEGWDSAMDSQSESVCQGLGEVIGSTFATANNIIYLMGGDHLAGQMNKVAAIRTGILVNDSNHIFSYHAARNSQSTDADISPATWDLNAIYTDQVTHDRMRSNFPSSGIPCFGVEAYYEDRNDSLPGGIQELREESWGWLLEGGCGHVCASEERWAFDNGNSHDSPGISWEDSLTRDGFATYTGIAEIFQSRAWWTTNPDTTDALVTSGRGTFSNQGYVTARYSSELAFIYMPDASSSIDVDMGEFSATVTAYWADPVTGDLTFINTFTNSGTQAFSTVSTNDQGDSDWVLLIQVE